MYPVARTRRSHAIPSPSGRRDGVRYPGLRSFPCFTRNSGRGGKKSVRGNRTTHESASSRGRKGSSSTGKKSSCAHRKPLSAREERSATHKKLARARKGFATARRKLFPVREERRAVHKNRPRAPRESPCVRRRIFCGQRRFPRTQKSISRGRCDCGNPHGKRRQQDFFLRLLHEEKNVNAFSLIARKQSLRLDEHRSQSRSRRPIVCTSAGCARKCVPEPRQTAAALQWTAPRLRQSEAERLRERPALQTQAKNPLTACLRHDARRWMLRLNADPQRSRWQGWGLRELVYTAHATPGRQANSPGLTSLRLLRSASFGLRSSTIDAKALRPHRARRSQGAP
jgi:hypothetical protein